MKKISGAKPLIEDVFVNAQRAIRLSVDPNQSSADIPNSVPPRSVLNDRFGVVAGCTEYQQNGNDGKPLEIGGGKNPAPQSSKPSGVRKSEPMGM